MSEEAQLRWTSAARTDIGLVRSNNEDMLLNRPERRLWAVADGMGGHAYGEVASRMTVEALDALPAGEPLQQAVAQARVCLLGVNSALVTEAIARNVPVIGTTLVLLLASGRTGVCLWAGDSRIYLCRGGSLHQLTRDHNQFEELQAKNHLSREEASAYPGANMITRALGAATTLELDEVQVQVSDGDMFLLCSDGLSNAVGVDAMFGALTGGDCAQAADMLIRLALAAGGRDNISVVVVRADDVEPDQTVLNPSL
ncbi:PP2C family protein-serine/threonine phosphatase [Massilia norwichensis]|uniref:Protein phosphatase 2C domain-containing protein n=1 Tax=Massilia norwichensis TaxID=1442366 RepID=A0ABT2ABQ7_9BURK|nr:protein phosphatase 2C domain-containing protein [Massilia norwichensis]MCS0591614.1 protein phosphatase 2C domain-containing protein [Massilia norwichensis]